MRAEPTVGEALGITCKRGHDQWLFDAVGHKRCQICRNTKRTRVSSLPKQARGPLGIECKRGHDDWMVDKNGVKRCYACKNGRSVGNWASRRIDPDGRRHYDLGSSTTLLYDTLTYSEVMKARRGDAA